MAEKLLKMYFSCKLCIEPLELAFLYFLYLLLALTHPVRLTKSEVSVSQSSLKSQKIHALADSGIVPAEIDLVQDQRRRAPRIYEGRFWGDLGFIHVCFDVRGCDVLHAKGCIAGFSSHSRQRQLIRYG